VGERMATLSFKECNFEYIGCLRKINEYNIYAEERKYIDWGLENIIKDFQCNMNLWKFQKFTLKP
jgi:hypothetical protein